MGRPAVAVAVVAFAVLSAAAPAVRAQDVQALVAQLADPAQRERACTQLLAAGAGAVAPLAAFLQQCTGEQDLPAEQATAALFVVGRLGAAAMPAMPAVVAVYRFSRSREVRRQALWALGEIAPASGDDELCRQTLRQLDHFRTSDLDGFLYDCVAWRLEFGPQPDPERCVRLLGSRGAAFDVAVARAVRAGMLVGAELDAKLGAILEQAVLRPPIPWHRELRRDAACGEIALTLWQCGRRDLATARGLLQHWDRVVRREALQQLGDPRGLSVRERLDVVCCLWDPDRSVRDLALASLQGWGADALVALPALRAFERHDRDDPFARACSRAADGVLRAVRQGVHGRPARVLLEDVDTLLRGGAWARTGEDADEEARQLLATVVTGAFGADAWVLEQLAELARVRGGVLPAGEPSAGESQVVHAFLHALGTYGEDSWRGAMRALITLGPVVVRVRPDFFRLAMESCGQVSYSLQGLTMAGASATLEDVRAAMESPRWMIVLRAFAEAAHRGAFDAATIAAARAAMARDLRPPERDNGARDYYVPGRRCGFWYPGPDRARLQAAFALLLAGAGEDPAGEPELRAAVATVFAVRQDDVASFLQNARAEQRLGELSARAERAAHSQYYGPMLER